MQGGVLFRGTSITQDSRYTDKQKKELRKLKDLSPILDESVDMGKVEFELIKRWIARRVTAILDGFEDDTLIGYIIALLEEDKVEAKSMLVNLIPFFTIKGAHSFMKDLWALLLDAQKNVSGVPTQLIEESKALLRQRRREESRIKEGIENTKDRDGPKKLFKPESSRKPKIEPIIKQEDEDRPERSNRDNRDKPERSNRDDRRRDDRDDRRRDDRRRDDRDDRRNDRYRDDRRRDDRDDRRRDDDRDDRSRRERRHKSHRRHKRRHSKRSHRSDKRYSDESSDDHSSKKRDRTDDSYENKSPVKKLKTDESVH